MLDINFIIKNQSHVQKSIEEKGVKNVNLPALIETYDVLKSVKQNLDTLRAERNKNTAAMKDVDSVGRKKLIETGAELKALIKNKTSEVTERENQFKQAMLSVPNVIAEDTPSGVDDSSNVPIRSFLEPTMFNFPPKDHVQIGKDLDIIDFPRGAKVAGESFYFLKNQAVFLEAALAQFVMRAAAEKGFIPMRTPVLAKDEILLGVGYAPKGEESNTYQLKDRDLSLIATSEIAVGGYHANEVLQPESLPLKYVSLSDCFRTETGGSGQASKGLYRVHQFGKVELFSLSKPEDSDKILEEIVALEESVYQALEIPHRVMRICAGDLGAPAYKKYDIEAWMPGRNGGTYGEITSASNCTDFQSRRLNTKYANSSTGKNEYVHTTNGTGVALSRTLIAIIENYQQADGTIKMPKALVPFLGFDKITNNNLSQSYGPKI
jgi:seryl-tRNA synthetase